MFLVQISHQSSLHQPRKYTLFSCQEISICQLSIKSVGSHYNLKQDISIKSIKEYLSPTHTLVSTESNPSSWLTSSNKVLNQLYSHGLEGMIEPETQKSSLPPSKTKILLDHLAANLFMRIRPIKDILSITSSTQEGGANMFNSSISTSFI